MKKVLSNLFLWRRVPSSNQQQQSTATQPPQQDTTRQPNSTEDTLTASDRSDSWAKRRLQKKSSSRLSEKSESGLLDWKNEPNPFAADLQRRQSSRLRNTANQASATAQQQAQPQNQQQQQDGDDDDTNTATSVGEVIEDTSMMMLDNDEMSSTTNNGMTPRSETNNPAAVSSRRRQQQQQQQQRQSSTTHDDQLILNHQGSEIHMAALMGQLDIIKELIQTNLMQRVVNVHNINDNNNSSMNDDDDQQKQVVITPRESTHLIRQFCVTKKGANLNTPLHLACFKGHLDIVQFLVEECDVDVDETNKDDSTGLQCACAKNQRHIAQYLITQGADIKHRDQYGYTAFHIAMISHSFEIANDLISFGAEIDARRFDGKTALHMMAEQGNLNGVKFLLNTHKSASSLNRDQKGDVPIASAIKKNKTEVVRFLCRYHRSKMTINQVVRMKNELGRNILHVAIDDLGKEESAYAMVRVLMELLFKEQTLPLVHLLLSHEDKVLKYTPLHLAAKRGYAHVVRLLLRTGALVNAIDEKGNTALHLILLAKPSARQDHVLFERDQLLTVKYLVSHPKCKLDLKNKAKQSPKSLIKAMARKDLALVIKNKKRLRREAAPYYSFSSKALTS